MNHCVDDDCTFYMQVRLCSHSNSYSLNSCDGGAVGV